MSTACTVSKCNTPAVARGLCRRHYSMDRRGRLGDAPRPEVGEPSGHGQYGVLDRDDETVLCHECGRRLGALGYHLSRAHDMTVDQYKDAHGLPRTLGLVSLRVSQRHSEFALEQIGSPAWRRLEAARDPSAASQARDASALRSPASLRRAAKAGRALSERQRGTGREKSCTVCARLYQGRGLTCGSEACRAVVRSRRNAASTAARYLSVPEDRADRLRAATGDALRALVAELQAAGVSSSSIGRTLDRSPAWMSRHFPRNAEKRPTP